jgi:hypothetical protein
MVQRMSRRCNRQFCYAQLSNEDFFPRHQRLWRGLRNLLTGSSVPVRAAALAAELQPLLQDGWQPGQEVCQDEQPPHIIYRPQVLPLAAEQQTACIVLPAQAVTASGGTLHAGCSLLIRRAALDH